jgi:hypothetical protein
MAKKPLKSTKVVQTLNPKNLEKTKSNSKALNFSKFFKKYRTGIISFALVLVLILGGSLACLRITNDQKKDASASNTDLNLYVSLTGDDNNDGTKIDTPYIPKPIPTYTQY